jgi:Methyltransferase domain
MTTCTSKFGVHHRLAEIALRHVTDCVAPKILDLASGNGGLSRRLLDQHPRVEVTVTDLDPMVVGNLALSDLGNHPRALVCDATAIDAPDGYFDLAVFARPLRQVPPATVTWIVGEGTRAASQLLIIDVGRLPPPPRTRWRAAASPPSLSNAKVALEHHRVSSSALSTEGHSEIVPPTAAKNPVRRPTGRAGRCQKFGRTCRQADR